MEFIIFDEPVTHHTLKTMTNDQDNNSVGGHKQKKKKKKKKEKEIAYFTVIGMMSIEFSVHSQIA